jgi:uncharacterized protein (DUF849 family)
VQFNEESLLPMRQDPLIITAVPFGWATGGASKGLQTTFTSAQQVKLALDCLSAGASVLHVELSDCGIDQESSWSGGTSALLSMLRRAAPKLLLQIDGPRLMPPCPAAIWSEREWVSNFESLEPKPHFMAMEVSAPRTTVASQRVRIDGVRDRHAASAQLRLLRRNGMQPFFLLRDLSAHEAVEHLVRAGAYMGPLNQCMVAASGGSIGNNPIDWIEFLRRAPAGSKVAFQGSPVVASPLTALAIAFGVHIRVAAPGLSLSEQDATPDIVLQIKQVVRTARQFGRKVATCDDARRIMSVGTWYDSTEETLFLLGMLAGRKLRG